MINSFDGGIIDVSSIVMTDIYGNPLDVSQKFSRITRNQEILLRDIAEIEKMKDEYLEYLRNRYRIFEAELVADGITMLDLYNSSYFEEDAAQIKYLQNLEEKLIEWSS